MCGVGEEDESGFDEAVGEDGELVRAIVSDDRCYCGVGSDLVYCCDRLDESGF